MSERSVYECVCVRVFVCVCLKSTFDEQGLDMQLHWIGLHWIGNE